jgi:hypothetical protein
MQIVEAAYALCQDSRLGRPIPGQTLPNSVAGRKDRPLIEQTLAVPGPGLVCCTAVATEFEFIRSMAECVRQEAPGSFLLGGGPHVSVNPEQCCSRPFDAVCIGEDVAPVA